jgi:hypothetical protein
MKEQGFKNGDGDHNLHVLRKDDKILVLTLYIDDNLFTDNGNK